MNSCIVAQIEDACVQIFLAKHCFIDVILKRGLTRKQFPQMQSTLKRCRFRLRFKAWMNSSLRACRTLKDLDLGVIVGYSSRSMISHRMPKGYAGQRTRGKSENDM